MGDILRDVQSRTGQVLALCYQCGKCTSGCPVADVADITVSQIVKMLQLGELDDVLSSSMIWLCVGCETCGTRCPNDINMAPVMDYCKQRAITELAEIPEEKVEKFLDSFIGELKKRGKMHEVSLIMKYKLKSGDLFSDLILGGAMFLKGKIKLMPSKVKDERFFQMVKSGRGDKDV